MADWGDPVGAVSQMKKQRPPGNSGTCRLPGCQGAELCVCPSGCLHNQHSTLRTGPGSHLSQEPPVGPSDCVPVCSITSVLSDAL